MIISKHHPQLSPDQFQTFCKEITDFIPGSSWVQNSGDGGGYLNFETEVNTPSQYIKLEFNIILSTIYQIPTLVCMAIDQYGIPCTFQTFCKITSSDKAYVEHTTHPDNIYRPCFQIHACDTFIVLEEALNHHHHQDYNGKCNSVHYYHLWLGTLYHKCPFVYKYLADQFLA